MNAIGLSGYAGSGKTLVANHLQSKYGFKRRHIAEPLRAMLRELLRSFKMDESLIWCYLEGPLKEEIIPELGVSGREAQITLGTEWGRRLINPDLWANAWAASIDKGEIPINDSVRFPNEADAIRDIGGIVIKLIRPGVGPAKFKHAVGKYSFRMFGLTWGVHDSERIDRIEADYEVENDGTVEVLLGEIDSIIEYEARLRRLDLKRAA